MINRPQSGVKDHYLEVMEISANESANDEYVTGVMHHRLRA